MGPLILAFLLGLGTAAAWVVYIRAVNGGRAGAASLADFAIMLAGSFTVQLWAWAGESFATLFAFDVGGALGTYLLVKGGYGH